MSFFKIIYHRIKWLGQLNLWQFFFYNYLTRKVVRDKGIYLIPYKGAVISIHRTARLMIKGENLVLCENRLSGSHEETRIKLLQNAVWECSNGATLNYGTTIEVHTSARLCTNGIDLMNTGSVIIAAKSITIGRDVLIGRDNVIYDSDFHQMLNGEGMVRNYPQEVIIEDHVWLTNHVMVQKGTRIGSGSVICPFTVLRKNVPPESMVSNGSAQVCVASNIQWSAHKVECN